MRSEMYASECCGAVFVPGFGHDNIVEAEGEKFHDATREGYCPSCGARRPDMMQVFPDVDFPEVDSDLDPSGS